MVLEILQNLSWQEAGLVALSLSFLSTIGLCELIDALWPEGK